MILIYLIVDDVVLFPQTSCDMHKACSSTERHWEMERYMQCKGVHKGMERDARNRDGEI